MEKRTPLYDCHVALNGKIVPFAGYSLPVQYKTGIIAEHKAVRSAAGIFDVSHMGELFISGKDAFKNIQNIVTRDITGITAGACAYSPNSGTPFALASSKSSRRGWCNGDNDKGARPR